MVPFKFMKDTTTGIREGKRMITITCSRAKTGEERMDSKSSRIRSRADLHLPPRDY